jgi:hypothetical protein
MKDRSVWPECREAGTHDRCAGSNATSECICWHRVLQQRQQRHTEHALELLVQIERELEWISARLGFASLAEEAWRRLKELNAAYRSSFRAFGFRPPEAASE